MLGCPIDRSDGYLDLSNGFDDFFIPDGAKIAGAKLSKAQLFPRAWLDNPLPECKPP